MIKNENLNFNGNKLKIVDNFLSDEDFQKLINLNIDKNIKKEFNIFHNEINENGIITSTIDVNIIENLHKNYHSSALNILKDINPEKAKLYDYSDFTIIVTNKRIILITTTNCFCNITMIPHHIIIYNIKL